MESPLIEKVGCLTWNLLSESQFSKPCLQALKVVKSEIYGLNTLSLSLSHIYDLAH